MQRSIIAPAERVTNLRWGIALLLGIGVLIGSLDRVSLMLSITSLHEFGISTMGLGYLIAGSGLAFAVAQIPFGALLDRYGVTLVGRITTFFWSLVALLSAGYGVGGPAGLGLTEAPAFSIGAKAIGYWFPVSERGLSTAIFDSAAKLAVAVGAPLMSVLLVDYGWRTMFLGTGIVSFLFFVAFYVFYRNPTEHSGLTHAEREYIRAGDAQEEGRPASGTLLYLLRQTKVWGLVIGFAGYAISFNLLLIWMPFYLVQTFKMTVLLSGMYTAIPWLVAALVDVLVGGFLVDTLIKRGMDSTRVRKVVLVTGMLMALSIAGLITTRDPNVAIVYITVALAGLAMAAPVAWSIPALIAPRGAVGSLASIMIFVGIIAASIIPISAGAVISATGSFTNLFIVAAAALVAGILSFVFLLGRIEPIPEPYADVLMT